MRPPTASKARWPKPTSRFVCQSCGGSPRNGPAAVKPAASGTPSWRKRSPPAPGPPRRRGRPRVGLRRARRRAPNRHHARPPASPNWTACWAAASFPPRPCWSAAIRASANRLCCCRPRPTCPRGPARPLRLRRGFDRADPLARPPPRRRRRALELAAAINVRDIAASLQQASDTALVVIDSIQTMWLDASTAPRAPSHRSEPPASN